MVWGRPLLFFLSFSFPFFPPLLVRLFTLSWRKVREYEPTVGNHIGSSASESAFDESWIRLTARVFEKATNDRPTGQEDPPIPNNLFFSVVAERPVLPTDALACTVAAI